MYKSILLLIILGLSIPLLHATNGATKKAQTGSLTNAEEDLGGADFWDFDPHADGEKTAETKTDESITIAPFKEAKKSKAKQATGTFDELKQLVDDLVESIESLENKAVKRIHGARMLQDFPLTDAPLVAPQSPKTIATVISEEEQAFSHDQEEEEETGADDNTETGPIFPEEQENDDQGQEETGNEDDGQTEPEEEVETVITQPEEQGEPEEQGTDNGEPTEGQEEVDTNVPQPEEQEETEIVGTPAENDNGSGMGTVTLSGSIEYDKDFDTFDKAAGKTQFINSLASLLSVDTAAVRITNIRRGSVIFDFEITSSMNYASDKDSTLTTVQYMDKLINDATKDGRLNIFDSPILNYKREILVFAPADDTNEPKGMGWIVTAAVLLSFIILGLICWLVVHQRKLHNESKLISKNIKYQMPSEQLGRADWESGPNMSVNESDSIKFYPPSPPNVLTYDGRSRQSGSPTISPSKQKTN